MSLARDIIDAYASARPREAARVIERLDDEHAVEILDGSEPSAASAVIGAMTPHAATRYLSRASSARAAAVLEELSLDHVASLLRRLDTPARQSLLAHVPEARRRGLERVLRYPEESAGGLMEPRVAAFHEDATVEETLDQMRRLGDELRYYLYVLDDDHKLTGVVSLRELARHDAKRSLRSIMARPVLSLSARASPTAIVEHPAWARYPLLPVVDETGALVGVFRYETLRHLEEHASEFREPSPLRVALALGELFWLGAAGLFRGMEPSPSAGERETPAIEAKEGTDG